MNIYTIYSPSHVKLYKEFTKNLGKLGLGYSPKKTPQLCSGDYPGSIDFWRLNIEYFLEICEMNTEPFLYLDCDVMVVKDPTLDLQKRLRGRDLVGQLDKRIFGFPLMCTGIMCIRPTDNVKRMFEWMLKHIERYNNDQKALNHYLYHSHTIKWGTLPKTYYSINYDNGNKVWDGGKLKIKKRDYKMVHLNWCIGNKLKLWNEIEMR